MNSTDLAFSTAIEQAAMVKEKEVSPVELVDLYLERIEQINPTLNAFVTLCADEARAAAKEAEVQVAAVGELKPFHGVPISIKDLHLTKGVRTTFASKAFAEFVPEVDENAYAQLKSAGFIMLGKTNTPEFGIYPWTESDLLGPCRNPWDTDRTCGGSSGGAASALAAGLCPVSQGSDGGGSIRIPAACNGLFGIKPARGRVSLAPLFGDQMNGLTTQGPLAHTVADAAALLDVMSGYVAGDPYWAPAPERPFADEVGADPGKLRIGVMSESPLGSPVHADCLAGVDAAAKLLEELGHDVSPVKVDLPPDFVQTFTQIWAAGIASMPIPDWSQTEQKSQDIAEVGNQISGPQYLGAVTQVQMFSRMVVARWGSEIDLLLTPVLADLPLPIGAYADKNGVEALIAAGEFVPFTPLFNATGQPAVSVPLHWNDDGLPIGVQLVGAPADEATLIRVSAQLEAAKPWRDRRPALATELAAA